MTGRLARSAASVALALLGVGGLAGCAKTSGGGPAQVQTAVLVPAAAFPVALMAERDGGFLYGERLTGKIRRVSADGAVAPDPVATVETTGAEDDQRGLLGLTRDARGRLLAAWTRPGDGRLVIGEVQAGPDAQPLDAPRLVWLGPTSAQLANGGHLTTAPDGRVIVGIGDLQADRALADDPTVPNRKLLALEPDGPADQVPTILSTGWNNPFAFTYDGDGTLWVADNTGAEGPERIGRGDRPAGEAQDLGRPQDGAVAPSALVSLGPGQLGLCGFLSGRMQLVRVVEGSPSLPSSELADGCSTGATVLGDHRIVVATPTEIRVRDGVVGRDS